MFRFASIAIKLGSREIIYFPHTGCIVLPANFIGMTHLHQEYSDFKFLRNQALLPKPLYITLIRHTLVKSACSDESGAMVVWALDRGFLAQSMSLYMLWGTCSPQPLKISRSLATAEFSMKSFILFMW